MASLEIHCAGSRQVPGATSPDEKLEAKLRAQGTRWPPAARRRPHELQARLDQPLLPGSVCSTSVSTAGQSHLSSTPRPSYRHARRERTAHTDAHTCTRVCTHANSSLPLLPVAAQATQEPGSRARSIEHLPGLLPKRSSTEEGQVLDPCRRLCLPHCQRLGPLQPRLCSPALLGAASSAQKAEKAPDELATQTRERPTQQNSPVPAGRMRRRGQERLERKRLSSDPSLRESTCEAKAKKFPEEGHLPVGGRGRLEDRGESEEACLSWRQGGSPS